MNSILIKRNQNSASSACSAYLFESIPENKTRLFKKIKVV